MRTAPGLCPSTGRPSPLPPPSPLLIRVIMAVPPFNRQTRKPSVLCCPSLSDFVARPVHATDPCLDTGLEFEALFATQAANVAADEPGTLVSFVRDLSCVWCKGVLTGGWDTAWAWITLGPATVLGA